MRIDTGIKGLEKLVKIPENYILLAGGTPGTGKTAFALDYLFEGIENGEKGLYVSLIDSEQEVKNAAELRGYDSESENFKVQEATDLMRAGTSGQVFEPEKVIDGLRRNLNEFEPDRIVFDTITKFLMIFDAEPVQRENVSKLVDRIKDKDSSAILLGEVPFSKKGQPSRYEIAEFVIDGILHFQQKEDDIVFNILKMKGLEYDGKQHCLKITDNEVRIGELYNPQVLDRLDEGSGDDSEDSEEVELN